MTTAESNPFEAWLKLQLELQCTSFVDPRTLTAEERATFLTWNAFAAEDEIHEAMQEVGWKPWATSRHMNTAEFLGEIVDALHFLGNMILTASINQHEDPKVLAQMLWSGYQAKVQVNMERQQNEYDGVSTKCPICKREMKGDPAYCSEHGYQA
jgi:hypothetical protein